MRVLVAMDESASSLRAAREAARLFPDYNTEFLVLNVARVMVPWLPVAPYGVTGMERGWDGTVEEPDEQEVAALARAAGIRDPHVLAESGDPVDRICEVAEQYDVDLIVVGGHDKGFLARLLDPSVSAAVVRATYRPVLVVSGVPPS